MTAEPVPLAAVDLAAAVSNGDADAAAEAARIVRCHPEPEVMPADYLEDPWDAINAVRDILAGKASRIRPASTPPEPCPVSGTLTVAQAEAWAKIERHEADPREAARTIQTHTAVLVACGLTRREIDEEAGVDDLARPADGLARDDRAQVAHRHAVRRLSVARSRAGHPSMIGTPEVMDPEHAALVLAIVSARAADEAAAELAARQARHRAELVAQTRGLDHLRPFTGPDLEADDTSDTPCPRAAAPPGVSLIATHAASNAPPRLGAGVFCRTPRRVT